MGKHELKDLSTRKYKLDPHNATLLQERLTPFNDFLSEIRNIQWAAQNVGSPPKSCSDEPGLRAVNGPIWQLTGMLMPSVHIADFYYRFHFLRSICQSPGNLSALLEKDDLVLRELIDSPLLDAKDHARHEETKVYLKFKNLRDNLLHTLARKRGIVPSSFFVMDIVRVGDHPIGCGGFADVWKGCMSEEDDDCGGIVGVWAGSTTDEDVDYPSQQVVALKVLKQFNTDGTQRTDLLKALCREAVVWKMMDHPNVLKFIGLSRLNDGRHHPSIALTSPWMKHGNLLAYVDNHEGADRPNLLAQVGKGLIYLHHIDIIHGDLKCVGQHSSGRQRDGSACGLWPFHSRTRRC